MIMHPHSFSELPSHIKGMVVQILIHELTARPDMVAQCIHIHRDKPSEKLAEGWAEGPGLWFSFDGGVIQGDRGRGHLYPRFWQRRKLRKAIDFWMRNQDISYRGHPAPRPCQHPNQTHTVWSQDGYVSKCHDCGSTVYHGDD